MRYYEYIKKFDFFQGIPQEILDKWISSFSPGHFRKGENLTFPADCQDAIYFVCNGKIKISYYSEEGKEFTVALLGTGEIYSEHSLAIATALEDSEIMYINMKKFRMMLEDCPALSMRLIKIIGGILRATNDVILDLAFREASARLARVLLREGQHETKADSLPRSFRLTHAELAGLSGTTRQTVNEILRRWERQGIVTLRRGKITILDWELLTEKL